MSRALRPFYGGAMSQVILAINCGSSSLKYAIFDQTAQRVAGGLIDASGTAAVEKALTDLRHTGIAPRAIGHRIVHGGSQFTEPVIITPDIRRHIADLVPLAPDHQPHHILAIDAFAEAFPGVPHIACFDTAFHRTIVRERQEMALPRSYAARGLLRYGFHGLSYQYIASQIPHGKVIACHLGNGCSVAAIHNGKSVYTSMGFTPMDGLMMGTRAGHLDPGAVLWLVEELGNTESVRTLINKESGLKGVSGLSPDMRQLLASKDPQAAFAIAMFVDRLVLDVGRAAAAMQGAETLVFTGGIGENAKSVTDAALARLGWLGATHRIITTDEESIIARSVQALLDRSSQVPLPKT